MSSKAVRQMYDSSGIDFQWQLFWYKLYVY